MSDRVDIVFTEKGAMRVQKRIDQIATSSYEADRALTTLSGTLAKMGKSNTTLLNATARLTNAQVRNVKASQAQQLASARLAIQNQKLTNLQNQNALANQRAAQATAMHNARINKMTQAQNTHNASIKRGIKLRSAFNRLMVFAGVTLTASHIIEMADAYTLLNNKLRNVTDSLSQLNQLNDEVFRVANRSRTSVSATAQAFQRFDLAVQQFGASQKESLRLTETVNKLLAISGANVFEQRNALLQLSQAFNKGKLDGDEFRSVMELIPPVGYAIAKELKTTRDELYKLAPQGIITAQVMRKALAGAADEADEKFSKMKVTLGQAFTVLGNSAIQALGKFEKATGFFNALANGVVALANNLDMVVIALTTLGVVAATTSTGLGILSKVALAAAGAFSTMWAAITGPIGLIIVGIAAVGTSIYNFYRFLNRSTKETDNNTDALRKGNRELEERLELQKALKSLGVSDESINTFSDVRSEIKNVTEEIKSLIKEYNNLENSSSESFVPNETISTLRTAPKEVKNLTARIDEYFNKSSMLSNTNDIINNPEKGKKAFTSLSSLDLKLRDLSLRIEEYTSRLDYLKSEKITAGNELLAESFKNIEKEMNRELIAINKLGAAREEHSLVLEMQKEVMDKLGDSAELFDTELTVLNAKFIMLAERVIHNKRVAEELNNIYNNTKGVFEEASIRVEAYTTALNKGYISAEAYRSTLASLRSELAALQNETGQGASWSSVMLQGVGEVIQGYTTMFAELGNLYGNFFSNLSKGFADATARAIVFGDDFSESMKDLARNALQEVISQLIQIAIRAIIVRALTSSMGGGGAIGGTIASAVSGFKTGGYTGNRSENDVAGIVHGREFVVNANATRKNRPMLEAMNSGRSVGNMSVNVTNTGTPQNYKVESLSPDEVRLIASDVVSREAPGIVANDMSNPNGKVSRSTVSNLKTSRRR